MFLFPNNIYLVLIISKIYRFNFNFYPINTNLNKCCLYLKENFYFLLNLYFYLFIIYLDVNHLDIGFNFNRFPILVLILLC
jgi:hypothetical protein